MSWWRRGREEAPLPASTRAALAWFTLDKAVREHPEDDLTGKPLDVADAVTFTLAPRDVHVVSGATWDEWAERVRGAFDLTELIDGRTLDPAARPG